MTIKVSLAAQIAEQSLHRDALAKAIREGKSHLEPRLDATEATIVTLETYQSLLQAGHLR